MPCVSGAGDGSHLILGLLWWLLVRLRGLRRLHRHYVVPRLDKRVVAVGILARL